MSVARNSPNWRSLLQTRTAVRYTAKDDPNPRTGTVIERRPLGSVLSDVVYRVQRNGEANYDLIRPGDIIDVLHSSTNVSTIMVSTTQGIQRPRSESNTEEQTPTTATRAVEREPIGQPTTSAPPYRHASQVPERLPEFSRPFIDTSADPRPRQYDSAGPASSTSRNAPYGTEAKPSSLSSAALPPRHGSLSTRHDPTIYESPSQLGQDGATWLGDGRRTHLASVESSSQASTFSPRVTDAPGEPALAVRHASDPRQQSVTSTPPQAAAVPSTQHVGVPSSSRREDRRPQYRDSEEAQFIPAGVRTAVKDRALQQTSIRYDSSSGNDHHAQELAQRSATGPPKPSASPPIAKPSGSLLTPAPETQPRRYDSPEGTREGTVAHLVSHGGSSSLRQIGTQHEPPGPPGDVQYDSMAGSPSSFLSKPSSLRSPERGPRQHHASEMTAPTQVVPSRAQKILPQAAVDSSDPLSPVRRNELQQQISRTTQSGSVVQPVSSGGTPSSVRTTVPGGIPAAHAQGEFRRNQDSQSEALQVTSALPPVAQRQPHVPPGNGRGKLIAGVPVVSQEWARSKQQTDSRQRDPALLAASQGESRASPSRVAPSRQSDEHVSTIRSSQAEPSPTRQALPDQEVTRPLALQGAPTSFWAPVAPPVSLSGSHSSRPTRPHDAPTTSSSRVEPPTRQPPPDQDAQMRALASQGAPSSAPVAPPVSQGGPPSSRPSGLEEHASTTPSSRVELSLPRQPRSDDQAAPMRPLASQSASTSSTAPLAPSVPQGGLSSSRPSGPHEHATTIPSSKVKLPTRQPRPDQDVPMRSLASQGAPSSSWAPPDQDYPKSSLVSQGAPSSRASAPPRAYQDAPSVQSGTQKHASTSPPSRVEHPSTREPRFDQAASHVPRRASTSSWAPVAPPVSQGGPTSSWAPVVSYAPTVTPVDQRVPTGSHVPAEQPSTRGGPPEGPGGRLPQQRQHISLRYQVGDPVKIAVSGGNKVFGTISGAYPRLSRTNGPFYMVHWQYQGPNPPPAMVPEEDISPANET